MGRKALLALVMFIFASYNFNSFLPVNNSFNDFGIINKPNISFNLNNKKFKGKYGGCSLTVEFAVVVRKTRVRLSPSAFKPLKKVSKTLDFEAKGATCAGLVHCL